MKLLLLVLFLNRFVLGQITYMNGYAFSSLISTYPTRAADRELLNLATVYHCLIRCGEDLKCMTMLYKDGMCHLYHKAYVDITATSPSPGWRNFNIYMDGCPVYKGYVHNRALGICYKLYVGGPRNAYDSMDTCASDGGELLKITTQEIQDHVAEFLAEATCHFVILIQGSDRNSEGTFLFEDYSALTYTHWNTGEPNNYLNDEDFIFLIRDQGCIWADGIDVASTDSSFMCEIQI